LAAPGTYKAWLSSSSVSAASRLTHATVPYRLVTGTHVAADWDRLVDGSLDVPLDVTEFGAVAGAPFNVWTNTQPSGAVQFGNPILACVDWATSSPFVAGGQGATVFANGGWTFIGAGPCPEAARLYCLQQ
jgi:hypothetical protein